MSRPGLVTLQVISKGEIEFTQYNGSFSDYLTGRLVEAAKRSGVAISFVKGERLGFVTLCVEKGREEDFWAAFR